MKKTMKKIASTVLAVATLCGCVATLSACETDHPEVEITLSFNNRNYVLEYELNRNVAPATVNHFLWLAGNGYYNGLCVHDYEEAKRMYTGAFSAATDNDDANLVYKKYYDTVKGYANFSSFPNSVWLDEAKSTPSYTLKGEFEDNHFQVTNGDLDETFGSLSMYYFDVSDYATVGESNVWTARASEAGKVNKSDYKYNMTTSMFYISLSTTKKDNSGYCTFAVLDEDSVQTLKNLQTAINDYIEEHFAENKEEFAPKTTMQVLEDDKRFEHYTVRKTFATPSTPIIVKSVSVTSY